MLYDDGENFVSIICSEKQGSDAGIQELYRLGLMRSTSPSLTFTVNTGMVSRVFYDEKGRITGHEVVDQIGHPIKIPHGEFPSSEPLPAVAGLGKEDYESNAALFLRERLPRWGFGEFKKALKDVTTKFSALRAIEELTRVCDTLPGWEIGNKDRGVLLHMVHEEIESLLDGVRSEKEMVRVTVKDAGELPKPENTHQALVVDARGFRGAQVHGDAVRLTVPGIISNYKIIKEKRATFIPSNEIIDKRPGQETQIKNLILAGDWVDTGLPPTIESAVKSGRAAANIIIGES